MPDFAVSGETAFYPPWYITFTKPWSRQTCLSMEGRLDAFTPGR